MSKTIEYKVKVDTGNSVKTLGQLETELEQINEELKDVAIGSDKFKELSKRSQDVTRDLEKVNQQVEGLTIDKKFEAADGAIKIAAGSVESLVGTLGILGIESEALGEFEQKAASAIAVGLGVKDISEGFNQLRKSTILAGAQAKIFGAVTKKALISTGIGALVVALGTIVAYWDEINDYVKSIGGESLEDLNDELNTSLETSEGIVSVLESQISLEQAKGGDTLETNKKLLDQLKLQLDITEQLIKQKEIELAESDEQDKQLSFWEGLSAQIQLTTANLLGSKAAYEGFSKTIVDATKKSEETIEKEKELNQLRVNRNNIEAKYVGISQTVATQEEMRAGSQEKVVAVTKGIVQVGQSVEEQLQSTSGLIDENTAAYLRQKGEKELAILQTQAQINKEQQYQEGLYASVDAITNLSNVLGAESTAAKALAISTALINTYLGVTEALKQKSTLPSPFDVITKVANVATILATGLKAVQSIKSTPARGTNGGGGGFGAPSVRSASSQAPSTPTAQTPSLQDIAAQTQIQQSQTNRQPVVEAYVLEGSVTSAQEASAKIRQRRRVGR